MEGCGLFLTRKRQTECIALFIVYDLKGQTKKAATSVKSQ